MAGVSDSNKAQLVMKQKGKPFTDDGILKPLSFSPNQLGVIFPYTPVSYTHLTLPTIYSV